MAKFLLVFREPTESRGSKPSPEEMQALAAAWQSWMQKFGSAIVVGDGLKHTGRVLKAGLVTDGPYAEAKEIIASFTIIQADDYDTAVAIARACPGDDPRWPNCPARAIEIREMYGYA